MVANKYFELLEKGKSITFTISKPNKAFIEEIQQTALITVEKKNDLYYIRKDTNYTLNKLVNLCKRNLKYNNITEEDFNNNCIEELMSPATTKTVINAIPNLINLSYSDIEQFKYNPYEEAWNDINYVKHVIMFNTIDSNLSNIKTTFAQTKKKMLEHISD